MYPTRNTSTNTLQANESSAESWSNYISSDEVIKGLDEVPGPDKWSPMFK